MLDLFLAGSSSVYISILMFFIEPCFICFSPPSYFGYFQNLKKVSYYEGYSKTLQDLSYFKSALK